MISLSSALIIRELIIGDFTEYLEGEREDSIYQIMAGMEGSYEKYSGWNEDGLKDNAIWALLLGYNIKILDINNKELMNTKKALESLPPLMKRRIQAISGFSDEQNTAGKEEFSLYPLFLGGKDIGHLEIKVLPAEITKGKERIFLQRANNFLILSIFALGGLSIVLSLVFSGKLTEPIKKLTTAAREIGDGNIKSRVSVSGNDELSELGRTFNIMAGNLEIQQSLRRKLTANIAHELRTPLTSMQGELEGMIDGLIKVDKERLLSLHEETIRLKKIIEGIEELSKAEASVLDLRKQPVEIRPFLNNIKERFEKLFSDKGVSLELESADTITFNANPDILSRIVINLLSNALKATGKGERVKIKAGTRADEDFIEFIDTGHGIKKEDLPFIFERFYRASEGGLGLGLTISKELAEAHGGRIEVISEYGKGATFTVYLPHLE